MASKTLLIINSVILMFIWLYPVLHFAELPEMVPTHFDGEGKVDGFGSKKTVFLEAGIATVLFGICLFVYLKPKMINLPEEMKKNPVAIKNFTQILCLITMLIFAFMMHQGIQISLGKTAGFSFPPGLVIGFLYLSIIGLLVYISKANENKQKS